MNFTFALIAMAAAATANASVSDAFLANAMASVSAAATDINGRRQLDNHEKKNGETQFMKIKCLKTGIGKNRGNFGAYQLDYYKKADCSDSDVTLSINGTKNSCLGGYMKVLCEGFGNMADQAKISFYSENSNCIGDKQALLEPFEAGDGKCHDPAAKIAPLTKECPAGSKNGAGSEVSLPLSYNEACCDKCEAKTPQLKTCAEVQKRISEGGCYHECFLALNTVDLSDIKYIDTFVGEDGKDLCDYLSLETQRVADCARDGKGKAFRATTATKAACEASGANTATVGLASIAILAVIAALGF